MATPRQIGQALDAVEKWAKREGLWLVREPPLTKREIDGLPALLAGYPYALEVPYRNGSFEVPPSYRAFLSIHRAVRLECGEAGSREVFRPFDVWAPTRKRLTASWAPAGAQVDDRPITTTELIAFANGGFNVEASRWCFYTRRRARNGEYAVLIEDNDAECLTGHYADNDEPLSDLMGAPPYASFGAWLLALCELTPSLFDPDDPDKLVNALVTRSSLRTNG